jgi:hypothetical protein
MAKGDGLIEINQNNKNEYYFDYKEVLNKIFKND